MNTSCLAPHQNLYTTCPAPLKRSRLRHELLVGLHDDVLLELVAVDGPRGDAQAVAHLQDTAAPPAGDLRHLAYTYTKIIIDDVYNVYYVT